MANTFPMAFSVMALNTARMGQMKYSYAVIFILMLYISSHLSLAQKGGTASRTKSIGFSKLATIEFWQNLYLWDNDGGCERSLLSTRYLRTNVNVKP